MLNFKSLTLPVIFSVVVACGGGGDEKIEVKEPAYVVTTIAGAAGQAGITDGTGSEARFERPVGIAVDSTGNVYVTDAEAHTVRKISPVGIVTTFAGSAGQYGSSDGTAENARFFSPTGLTVDENNNIYIADYNNVTIRKITPAGNVTTYAGTALNYGSDDGESLGASFRYPMGLTIDTNGTLYVADSGNNTIRKISPSGTVSTLAGTAEIWGYADGVGSAAKFDGPGGIALDVDGNIYVPENGNNTIRKVTPTGSVTTFAGAYQEPGISDGAVNIARFSSPYAIAIDNDGNIFVADTANHTIRKITRSGKVNTIAGSPGLAGSTDGKGELALFNNPTGVAVDTRGNIYVVDTGNKIVRKITIAP